MGKLWKINKIRKAFFKSIVFVLFAHKNALKHLTVYYWWPENVKRFTKEWNREWNTLNRGYGWFQALCRRKETTLQWGWLDIEYLTDIGTRNCRRAGARGVELLQSDPNCAHRHFQADLSRLGQFFVSMWYFCHIVGILRNRLETDIAVHINHGATLLHCFHNQ